MCENKRDQEQGTILGGLGDIVEDVNKTVRITVEKGAAGAEALGENLKETILGLRTGRDNVVMVRVDDDSKSKLDELLDANIVNSRSGGAAFLIAEGIKARSQLFDTISELVEDIRRKREELQKSLPKTHSNPCRMSERSSPSSGSGNTATPSHLINWVGDNVARGKSES